jgi:hypothetical protein
MPEKRTIERAKEDQREGKPATTQAGEFVREEMEHVREGKHGVKGRKQAIAIGLSKARKAGVDLPPPGPGKAKDKTRKSARRAYQKGRSGPLRKTSSAKRSSKKRSAKKTSARRSSTKKRSTRKSSSKARGRRTG